MKRREAILRYTLERTDGPERIVPFYSSGKIPDIDTNVIQNEAERMCRHFKELYGGDWIYRFHAEEPPIDNLRGQAARDKAFANILAGPNTPGRRWLIVKLSRAKADVQQIPNAAAEAVLDEDHLLSCEPGTDQIPF